MSGIFDLFGGTGNVGKQQSSLGPTEAAKKSAVNSTMFSGGMAGKNAGLSRSKPKGLSFRSSNDLNISNLSIKSSKLPTRTSPIKGFLKPEAGQSLSLSPRSKAKALKMQILQSKQLKALSSKSQSPENNLICGRKQAEEIIFKKPITPKKTIRKVQVYKDPEVLANYYDMEKDFDDFTVDTEFVDLLKKSKESVAPHQDEGFESDPESTRTPTPTSFSIFVSPLDEGSNRSAMPDLPSLSDDDDDFWD